MVDSIHADDQMDRLPGLLAASMFIQAFGELFGEASLIKRIYENLTPEERLRLDHLSNNLEDIYRLSSAAQFDLNAIMQKMQTLAEDEGLSKAADIAILANTCLAAVENGNLAEAKSLQKNFLSVGVVAL
ncbi:MAG: hypothetical protein GVY13_07315 [Alphaproteobacteria bacterium]|jgi:hypothetical protein|nr:hypothetical protein [Alphaproteobacteria bacterium]